MSDKRTRTISLGRMWAANREQESRARTPDELATAYFYAYAADITRHLTAAFPTRDVEDAVQDAFLRLHAALCEGEEIEHPRAWALKVATNQLLDRIRKERTRKQFYQHEIELIVARMMAKAAGSPEDVFLARQRRQALRESLSSLSDLERQCLYQRAEGQTLAEIGRLVGLDLRRVSETVMRAVRTLQEKVRG